MNQAWVSGILKSRFLPSAHGSGEYIGLEQCIQSQLITWHHGDAKITRKHHVCCFPPATHICMLQYAWEPDMLFRPLWSRSQSPSIFPQSIHRWWACSGPLGRRVLGHGGCIVADMLSILINRAKKNNQIKGVTPHLMKDGLSILQYAVDHDLEQPKNMKFVLSIFEQLLGLKINFHKSEIFYFGEAKRNCLAAT